MTGLDVTGEHDMSIDARRAMATELHDGAMQELTLARLQIDLLMAGAQGDQALVARLGDLSDLLREASADLLDLMHSLVPGVGIV